MRVFALIGFCWARISLLWNHRIEVLEELLVTKEPRDAEDFLDFDHLEESISVLYFAFRHDPPENLVVQARVSLWKLKVVLAEWDQLVLASIRLLFVLLLEHALHLFIVGVEVSCQINRSRHHNLWVFQTGCTAHLFSLLNEKLLVEGLSLLDLLVPRFDDISHIVRVVSNDFVWDWLIACLRLRLCTEKFGLAQRQVVSHKWFYLQSHRFDNKFVNIGYLVDYLSEAFTVFIYYPRQEPIVAFDWVFEFSFKGLLSELFKVYIPV